MPMQTWVETLAAATSDSTALTNTVTETTILPTNAKPVIPSNFFDRIGSTLRIMAAGRISNVVTAVPTMTFKLKLGSVAIATSQAFSMSATAQTNDSWWLEWILTLRANGAAANFMHVGQFMSGALNNNTAAPQTAIIPATAPAVGTSFDSSVAAILDLTGTWSAANAANSITTHLYVAQSFN